MDTISIKTTSRVLNWWERRTVFQQVLIIVVLFSVFGGALIIILASCRKTCPKTEICLSEPCIHITSDMLSRMDIFVDPCEDFYTFACGGYLNRTQVPEDQTYWNDYSQTDELVYVQIESLLSKKQSEIDKKTPWYLLAKSLYDSCMNQYEIESSAKDAMLKILTQLGGWPVVEGDNWEPLDIDEILVKAAKLGFHPNYVISIDISPDWHTGEKRMLEIDEGVLGLEKEHLNMGSSNPIVKSYLSYMKEVAILLGADPNRTEEEMEEVLEFEIELAELSPSASDRKNLTAYVSQFPIEDLQIGYDFNNWNVDWTYLINGVLPDEVLIEEQEIISVAMPFPEQLGEVLDQFSNRTIANYVIWRMIKDSISYLPQEFRFLKLQHEYRKIGLRREKSRSRTCVEEVNDQLPVAIAAIYVEEYFPESSKEKVTKIYENIRDDFQEILETITWMDSETRSKAIQKLKQIRPVIGYPNELLNETKIMAYYDGLELSAPSYLEKILQIQRHSNEYRFSLLQVPYEMSDDWFENCKIEVNAFHIPIYNSVHLPAGILQGVFYSPDRPEYLNYAALGSIIGHEITHAFDDEGKNHGPNGTSFDWWEPEAEDAFNVKTKCFIEQYSSFRDPTTNLSLDGINTLSENIADNGGIKESYYAYKRWAETNGPEAILPAFNFTVEQLFWIASAQPSCTVYTKAELKSQILSEDHALDRFRIIGTISNNEDFARDFKCEAGSKMNPEKKCEIW